MTDLTPSNAKAYTPAEFMIVAAARSARWRPYRLCRCRPTEYRLQFGSLTVAPELELIYELGVDGAQPARQPLSIGDPTLVTGATSVISMADLLAVPAGWPGRGGLIRWGANRSLW